MVKLLLINAINPYSEVQNRFPSLGLGYLASSLRSKWPEGTFKIRIIDHDIEKQITLFRPDVIGITSVTQNYGFAVQYARAAKEWGIPVVIGGMHVSVLPDTLSKDMDVAVIGEGEETFADLMKIFLQYGHFPGNELADIPGLAFRDADGTLHRTAKRPWIEPMDQIRPPARDLLQLGSRGGIFSSRGCPYRCTFCFSSRYWDKLRFFSAEYVVEELKEMVGKYGMRRVSFYDDLMIADPDRLQNIVELINREKSLSRVKFKVLARANLITNQSAQLLARMNVNAVGLGLESGNPRVLRYLKGGSVSVEDNYAAIVKLHNNGISAQASFVIGSPGETRKEILDTLNFIKESDLDFFDVYVLTPFPGTPIWDYAKSIGQVQDRGMDWGRLNVNYHEVKDPVLVSGLPKAEIDELYRKFRRHRVVRTARRIYYNPFLGDILKAGMNKVFNKCGFAGCR